MGCGYRGVAEDDGDCVLRLGAVVAPVESVQSAKLSSLAGQSPLPDEDPH
jgi:hypothetical protein